MYFLNNQECKTGTKIKNINNNNYPFSIKINKCSGNCNTINDPYAKICVLDSFKSMNVNVFNLMSITNETRHIEWHKTCKCKCRLDASVSNNKQRWSEDKCRCECKELIDKEMCDKGFIWNPINCECECDKLCNVGEYLDYESCKCRKRIIDKLVEECSENIDRNEMLYNETLDVIPLNVYKKVLHDIYSIICCILYNKHMHLLCFYLSLLVFKKR